MICVKTPDTVGHVLFSLSFLRVGPCLVLLLCVLYCGRDSVKTKIDLWTKVTMPHSLVRTNNRL